MSEVSMGQPLSCVVAAANSTTTHDKGSGNIEEINGEELDTENQEWSNESFLGHCPSPRSLHTATCVGDKIVVFGGHEDNSAKNDVYILDTVTHRWAKPKVFGTPPSPRCAHSAVLIDGERILIYGGRDSMAKGDIWFLEVNTAFVRLQSKLLNMEVVAWSKGVTGKAPRPVVICGPSGVGKGTLIGKLMKDFPDSFGFSVSHTTRRPREKEQDGVHYHFTQRHTMEKEITERKFLESADVHGNLYGTSWAAVDAVTNSGKTCILDIDVQGAQSVKKSPLDAIFVFIKPPYPEEAELRKRLRGRGTESEEQIQKRLRNAKAELERAKDSTLFDHILINAKLDEAYENLKVCHHVDVFDKYAEDVSQHTAKSVWFFSFTSTLMNYELNIHSGPSNALMNTVYSASVTMQKGTKYGGTSI
ncbi:unnamed protein product, partial [Sphagnum balticum]